MELTKQTDESLNGAVRSLVDASSWLRAAMDNYRQHEKDSYHAGQMAAYEQIIRAISDELHALRGG